MTFVTLFAYLLFVFVGSGFAISHNSIVPVTNKDLYFSPYNTFSNGTGPLLSNNVRAGSSYAIWVNPGSYLKTTFQGTSAVLQIGLTQGPRGQMPKVQWSIDDGPLETRQLLPGAAKITLASHLKSGAHTLWFIYAASDANLDRWRKPVAALKIYGIALDLGSKALPPSLSISLRPKRAIFFGDSITEGAWILGTSTNVVGGKYVDWVANSDAALAWPRAVASALNAEYGTCAFGGTSWTKPALPFIPPLPESWSFYYKGHSRLTGGKLEPVPDYVLVNMGTNDRDSNISPAITEWLQKLRAAVSPQTDIIVIIPFGQMNRSKIMDAVAKVKDRHLYIVDLGPQWAYGLDHYGQASLVSFDGLHPSVSATAGYAAALTMRIESALDRK